MLKKILIIVLLFFLIVESGFAEIPKRIVSLAPSITEILFLLDLEKQIVGVTANCDYPQAAKKIEKIGLFGSPNLEKIVSLKPDLVLAPDLGKNPTIARLRDLNIPTVVLPSESINDVIESIKTVGKLTGREKMANVSIHGMQSRIKAIEKKLAGSSRPKVLVILWVNSNTIMTAGRRSFINELIHLAGGENIAAEIDFRYPMISPEFILAENPEVIIFGDSLGSEKTIKDLLAQPGIKNTAAAKNGRIYRDINPDLFLRPGPRLVEGLEEIAKKLHPDIFLVTEADRL